MTASAARRRRRTVVAGAFTGVGMLVAAVLVAVAVVTLRSSEEGEAVVTDNRPVEAFPSTPNAAIAIVDDEERLTSVVVATLDPSGVGGSLVVVPSATDVTGGFGGERRPLDRQPFTPGDADAAQALRSGLEPALTLTIESVRIVGPDELLALVEPLGDLSVDFDVPVVDADTVGTGIVADAGEQTLRPAAAVDVLTAIDTELAVDRRDEIDAEVWRAFAEAATSRQGAAEVDVPLDEFGRPVDPTSVDELLGRLFAGPVGVRPLAVDASATAAAADDAEPGAPGVVVLDRRDVLLVFGQISPELVSTPNPALSFAVYAPFEAAQLDTTSDGASVEQLTRQVIGELVFFQANVVAVNTTPAPGGAGERTLIEVQDEAFVEDVALAFSDIWGPTDVVVADQLIDGVDAVVTLGTGYLERREERLFGDGVADDATDAADATDTTEPADGVEPEAGEDAAADTVDADE